MKTSSDRVADIYTDYIFWIRENEKDVFKTEELLYNPLISVVVPVYNVETHILSECIESVISQTYKSWELILIDDASTLDTIRPVLEGYVDNERIKIIYRSKNGNISTATNDGIKIATGEYVGFLDNDDLLAPNALYEVACKLNEDRELAFIYSDQDNINEDGTKRSRPFFKPDWSPDTLLSYNYCNHFSIYRRDMVEETGYLRSEYNGAQDYDFVLRFTENCTPDKIGHIPKILYHWRESATSTAAGNENKSYVRQASKKVKEEAFKRRGIQGYPEWLEDTKEHIAVYDTPGNPLVSIVILSKDNLPILRQCTDSIEKLTRYKNYEIIVVDNGSTNKDEISEYLSDKAEYIYRKMDFNFSAQCNIGAKAARGEYILLLNDDIEIIQPDWLDRLLGQAMQPHTGAVGAKLYYPGTKKIQHAGIINIPLGPSPALAYLDDSDIYYFGRNRLTYNYLSVTAACLMCAKDKYFEVGGLNEALPVAYNDVDFCLRLYEHGYYNVLRNDVTAYHYESLTRGRDSLNEKKRRRLEEERKKLWDEHIELLSRDPFYSINLTMTDTDFSLRLDGEIRSIFKRRLIRRVHGRKAPINMFVDAVTVADIMKVEGWSTSGDFEWDEKAKKTLLLRLREDYIIEVETYPIEREDLVNTIESKSLHAGFVAKLDTDIFKGEARNYTFGIRYEYKGKSIYSFSDTCLELSENDSKLGTDRIGDIGTDTKKIAIGIDVFSKTEAGGYISGWSYNKGSLRGNAYYYRFLVAENEDERIKLRLHITYRDDMVRRHPFYSDMLYSGFEAVIPPEIVWQQDNVKWYMVYEDLRTNKLMHREIEIS